MSDTAIVGENIEVIQTSGPRAAFSWSVVIAGALAAWAVSFIFVALGAGIGLSVASPYGGPSAAALGIGGAIWLIFSHTVGFATGGYLAARLRIRDHIPGPETKFRDAAHGFMAWVIGASLMGAALFLTGAFATKTAADAAGPVAGGAVSSLTADADNQGNGPIGYYVDRLFRANPATPGPATSPTSAPNSGVIGATPGAAPSATPSAAPATQQDNLSPAQRLEAARIMLNGIRSGSLSDPDREYLAQLVAARAGLSQEEAARRVTDIQQQASAALKQTADAARKAGAYLSFWSFMALLFGAVAATLAGLLGGELRDEI